MLTIAAVVVLLGLSWLLLEILVFSKREVTDDAYIGGNQVRISSQVIGTVVEVRVRNTSRVEAGQVILRLDPTDAQQALDRAAASLAQTVRRVRQTTAQSGQFDAQIVARELELRRAEDDVARREPLLAEEAVAAEEVRHAREDVQLARAQLTQARRQAAAARALIDNVPARENPLVLQAVAAYRDAWLAVQRTTIVAPVAGHVAMRSVQLGQRIAPGEPLLSIVPLQDLWLDANFKESQLRNLRIGQPVHIESDLYGGDVEYTGQILGLSAGTGAAFSLLPPQNASGNWIKVVQRVAVKVTLDPQQIAAHPLRIGLSMTARVDTRDRTGQSLASEPTLDFQEATTTHEVDLAAASAAADAIVQLNLGE
jgi:membrane fusion protein, multidrug efflux system